MKFTVRALLIFTAMVALTSALLFAVPDAVASIGLLALSFVGSAALLSCAIYGHENMRAFAVGALIPVGLLSIFVTYNLVGYVHMVFYMGEAITEAGVWEIASETGAFYKTVTYAALPAAVLCGLTSVTVRWLVRPGPKT